MTQALEKITNLPINIDDRNIILKKWYNRPWNDSVADLICNYYFALNAAGAAIYEGDAIYINDDGTIDTEHTKGIIKIKNSKIRLRWSDVLNADAGHSFSKEEELYSLINYVEGFKLILNYCVNGNKKEVFNTPFILVFDRKEYLLNHPIEYDEIFSSSEIDVGFNNNTIIDNLTKNGWKIQGDGGVLDFIEKYYFGTNKTNVCNSLKNKSGKIFGQYKEEIKKLYKANRNSLWVIPWYNISGKTYKLVRGNDLKLSVISWGEENDVSNINKGKYFLDFTRLYSQDENKWLRLLMPQYKRRVEVEDLNRNFWVIAQTISAMMAYLFDPEGPYQKLVGGTLNEIMQLWENVLFLWSEIAATTKKHPDTVAKIVYISPENLSDYLSYDDFDVINIIGQYQSAIPVLKYIWEGGSLAGVRQVNTIVILEKNQDFENIIINYLREYRKKFANKNVILIPVVRLHNYEHNYFKRIICPGIYRYFINTDGFQKMVTERGFTIPTGEIINDVFRTDSQLLDDTNPILLNYYKESFQSITFLNQDNKYYLYDIGMDGLSKVIAGISEKEDETGYLGINKLEKSEDLKTSSEEKVFGLVKPVISVESHASTEYCGAEHTSFYIEAYDLAKYFIKTGNKIENDEIKIGEDDYIVYRDWYSDNEIIGPTKIDRRRDSDWISNDEEKAIQTYNIDGNFGYYLGELLSEKRNSSKLQFNVITLREKILQPTWIDEEEYKAKYGRQINDNPEILQDVQDDKITLMNVLKNVYDKWAYGSTKFDQFWEDRKNALSDIGGVTSWNSNLSCRVSYATKGQDNNITYEPIEKNRELVKLSNGLNEDKFKWGDPNDLKKQDTKWEERWKKDAWNSLDNLTGEDKQMSEASILFVNGVRNTNWKTDINEGREGGDCYAKDGLLHHLYNTTSANTVQAGAAIRIPIGGGDAGYGFYSLHTKPTATEWEIWGITMPPVQMGRQNIKNEKGEIESIPYQGTMLNDNGDVAFYKNGDLNYKEEDKILYMNYKKKSLFVKKDNNIIPRFLPMSGYGDTERSQYSVLRKTEDTEFTENNWLIVKTDQFYDGAVAYYEFEDNDKISLTNLEKPFSEIDQVQIGKDTGILNCIHEISPFLDMYYKHTYQKYVNSIISKWNNSDKLNKTLENVYEDLRLKDKLFGWLRIMDLNGQTERTITYSYNNPFDYGKKVGYTDKQQALINNLLRSRYSIAGCIKSGETQQGSDIKKNELKEILQIFGYNGLNIENCYYMGNFANLYKGSTFTVDEREEIYYEDRIMGHIRGLQEINQLDLIYKNAEKRSALLKMAQYQFDVFPNKWYSRDRIEMYRKIAQWLTPQENPSSIPPGYNISLKFPIADSSAGNFIEINDRLCFTANYCYRVNIYVFGPESLGINYARRGIARYPFNCYLNDSRKIEEITRRHAIANQLATNDDFGKWPVRPNNLETNYEPNWKDDYEITGEDIDTLRDGYSIISTTVVNSNYEKYKTRQSEDIETYYHNVYGGLSGDDDNDFDNIWTGEQ